MTIIVNVHKSNVIKAHITVGNLFWYIAINSIHTEIQIHDIEIDWTYCNNALCNYKSNIFMFKHRNMSKLVFFTVNHLLIRSKSVVIVLIIVFHSKLKLNVYEHNLQINITAIRFNVPFVKSHSWDSIGEHCFFCKFSITDH